MPKRKRKKTPKVVPDYKPHKINIRLIEGVAIASDQEEVEEQRKEIEKALEGKRMPPVLEIIKSESERWKRGVK